MQKGHFRAHFCSAISSYLEVWYLLIQKREWQVQSFILLSTFWPFLTSQIHVLCQFYYENIYTENTLENTILGMQKWVQTLFLYNVRKNRTNFQKYFHQFLKNNAVRNRKLSWQLRQKILATSKTNLVQNGIFKINLKFWKKKSQPSKLIWQLSQTKICPFFTKSKFDKTGFRSNTPVP
jgi:hypothetical protein